MDKAGRILIVDDEPQNIKVLAQLLRPNYQVMAAKSGEVALTAARGPQAPDLILLDILMPEMDGYAVCRRLKEDTGTMHIPVIFLSALDAPDEEARGFELGAVDYIKKPFHPVIVSARIKTHMQLKRKSDLLEIMAAVDGLTEIANRRSFDLAIEKEIRRAERNRTILSLILIDIDFFKKYNDHYGHATGDDCLRKIAGVLKKSVRRPFDLAARYGGEEFAVILPETDGSGALYVAESIQQAVAEAKIPHAASGICPYVSVSMGVMSTKITASILPEHLIRQADTALYRAKQQGRNQICCQERNKDRKNGKIPPNSDCGR